MHRITKTQVNKCEKMISSKSTKEQMCGSTLFCPEALAERLRRFCYERREKEARAVREALDLFLTKEGF